MASTTFFFQDTAELEKIFRQFDTNGDGKISLSELGGVLKSMGSTYSQEELERVMDEVDTDKDGFINLEEFASLCSTGSAAEELKDAFDLYDQNKNGLISKTELHQVLTRLGMSCSVEDCVKMIQSVDSDGDGCVNFEEFKQMMAAKNGSQN